MEREFMIRAIVNFFSMYPFLLDDEQQILNRNCNPLSQR